MKVPQVMKQDCLSVFRHHNDKHSNMLMVRRYGSHPNLTSGMGQFRVDRQDLMTAASNNHPLDLFAVPCLTNRLSYRAAIRSGSEASGWFIL
jgi:hypothetical protein